ncbi:MAG: HAMP domain-containing sensor histidine kinase [Actinomycetota bacterium]
MAVPETAPGTGSPSRALRGVTTLIAVALLFVVAAAATGLALYNEIWPWLTHTAGASCLAGVAALAQHRHDRRYRRLLDGVPVGLYRTAPDGRIVDVNPALARLFGFETPAELLAAPARSVYVDPADRDRWMSRVNQAQGPIEAELLMRHRDGTPIWVRDRVVPVRDRRGRVRCYEGQLEDITDEKQHREQLEAALRSKIELIGTVSHELRNPLTTIVGYAHLLSEARDPGSAEQAEMAAVVKQQAEDVANIVEDLLTAAQADAGTLRVVSAPLDLADEAHRALAGLSDRHAGTLEVVTPPAPALGDAMRVRQIVRNLVVNAIVHGGEHIRVATTRDAQQARLVVTDDGPGLAPGDEQRVFEPFQHGDRETRGHASVGLGLTISRQLARLMGGDLTYRREGSLTVFRLVLSGRHVPPSGRVDRPRVRTGAPVA